MLEKGIDKSIELWEEDAEFGQGLAKLRLAPTRMQPIVKDV